MQVFFFLFIMVITLQQMIQAGLHIGHFSHQWNPKMIPYIYKEKNSIHIIDLVQTYFYLQKALHFLYNSTAQGKTILFVGTKKQVSKLVERTANQCNSFFVTERWLGGLLTNWLTVQKSISKLALLENQKRKIDNLQLSKKEISRLKKKKDRLEKYLGGLKNMTSLPDIVIIIDQQREITAVQECQKLGIRSITILDTNGDPNLADLFIPGNDDSIAALNLILNELSQCIILGQRKFKNYTNSSFFKLKKRNL